MKTLEVPLFLAGIIMSTISLASSFTSPRKNGFFPSSEGPTCDITLQVTDAVADPIKAIDKARVAYNDNVIETDSDGL